MFPALEYGLKCLNIIWYWRSSLRNALPVPPVWIKLILTLVYFAKFEVLAANLSAIKTFSGVINFFFSMS